MEFCVIKNPVSASKSMHSTITKTELRRVGNRFKRPVISLQLFKSVKCFTNFFVTS